MTGKPPSHWFTGNRGEWTDRDYILQLALTKYEGGLCSCGQPMILAHDKDNEGWYEPHKTYCYSCAARETATQGDGKNPYKPEPGERVYTALDPVAKTTALKRRASRHN
ncbi:hypothetical protein [Pseudarthrobacter sp. PS3-L1]|uniref:hypothetical protein n=1 Tax=Pseudarthrobacter sp. PS3-L1 TaxID=3046207 RepID=UPI0024B8A03F|nr:hypothetical protein [Pseudarthrobacter sp. PS3-L1]MDJ0321826.1 hypothetical protein [Pseudarthrobacter sp. PS3-L1]